MIFIMHAFKMNGIHLAIMTYYFFGNAIIDNFHMTLHTRKTIAFDGRKDTCHNVCLK
jgi:hypothetical protein